MEMELPTSALTNPLGAMGDLAQAAVSHAQSNAAPLVPGELGSGEESGKGDISALMLLAGAGSEARPSKRARFIATVETSRPDGGLGEEPVGGPDPKPKMGEKRKGLEDGPGMAGNVGGPPVGPNGIILDCVDAGLVGLEEAKALVEL